MISSISELNAIIEPRSHCYRVWCRIITDNLEIQGDLESSGWFWSEQNNRLSLTLRPHVIFYNDELGCAREKHNATAQYHFDLTDATFERTPLWMEIGIDGYTIVMYV